MAKPVKISKCSQVLSNVSGHLFLSCVCTDLSGVVLCIIGSFSLQVKLSIINNLFFTLYRHALLPCVQTKYFMYAVFHAFIALFILGMASGFVHREFEELTEVYFFF